MLKNIDLSNKCGSCCHFKPIEDTATGECLQNPYNDSVVHDPKHPHWIVQRSRIKCPLYNAKPQTNADRIRAMSDEELADFLCSLAFARETPWSDPFVKQLCKSCPTVRAMIAETGEVMELNECNFVGGKCPHGDDVLWWLRQPVEADKHG